MSMEMVIRKSLRCSLPRSSIDATNGHSREVAIQQFVIGTDEDGNFGGQAIIEVEASGVSAGETIAQYKDEYSWSYTGDYAFEYQLLSENGETQAIQPQTSLVIGGWATAGYVYNSGPVQSRAFEYITKWHIPMKVPF